MMAKKKSVEKWYDVRVTIDRGSSPSQINYARFVTLKANPWPLTLDAAKELADQERAKYGVNSAEVVESDGRH